MASTRPGLGRRLSRAPRRSPPVLRVTLPPKLARWLIAAGARPVPNVDEMEVMFPAPSRPMGVAGSRIDRVPEQGAARTGDSGTQILSQSRQAPKSQVRSGGGSRTAFPSWLDEAELPSAAADLQLALIADAVRSGEGEQPSAAAALRVDITPAGSEGADYG